MDYAWRLFSLSNSPLVAQTTGGFQTEGETMQAVTHNGSAEYRVAQAIEEEAVRRAPRVQWHVWFEVLFAIILVGSLVWSLWR